MKAYTGDSLKGIRRSGDFRYAKKHCPPTVKARERAQYGKFKKAARRWLESLPADWILLPSE